MEQSKVTRLSELVEAFDGQIALLHQEGLAETALLLEMARLDLQTRLHDISEQDLKDLCAAIESGELSNRTPLRVHTRAHLSESATAIPRSSRHSARQGLRASNATRRLLSKDNQHA